MENNNVEQGELFKFFKEKSEGVGFTFDQLYEKCTSYVDHFEFSRELNRLVKLKLIQKQLELAALRASREVYVTSKAAQAA